MSYTTPPENEYVTMDVPACDRTCGKDTAHVHLPTYNRVRVNEDGTVRIRAPADYFTPGGGVDRAFIERAYMEWERVHGARLPASAREA